MTAGPPLPDYLLDTSVLSRLLDPRNPGHGSVRAWESALPAGSLKLISVVALAELRFGMELARVAGRATVLPALEATIREAEKHAPLETTRATAHEYARLKARIVEHYLPKRLQQTPNKGWGNPEGWINEFTGERLQIQENDLWQCAQAIERDLLYVCCDRRIEAVQRAVGSGLKVEYIPLTP